MKIAPELMVKDIAKAIAFYRDILGFEVQVIFPEDKPIFAKISYEDADLMLYDEQTFRDEMPHLAQPISSTMALYIDINNIKEWQAKVDNKAQTVVPLHNTSYGTKEFAILDPNGYTLIFAENKT